MKAWFGLFLLLLGLPNLRADDRLHTRIDEFDLGNETFNRIIIHNDPSRIFMAPRGAPQNTEAQHFQWAMREYFYARFIQSHLQEALVRNFEAHAIEADINIRHIIDSLNSFPHSLRNSRYQGSNGQNGEIPASPLTRVDDLFLNESLTVLITAKNDLNRIWAAIRIVAMSPERLFSHLGTDPNYGTFLEALKAQLATDGRKAFQVEQLSFARGPHDFFDLGLKTLNESRILNPLDGPRTQIFLRTRWRLAPYYLGMNFKPLLNADPYIYLHMAGEDLEKSAQDFSHGIFSSQIRHAEIERQARIILAVRARKNSAHADQFRPIDYTQSFLPLSALDPARVPLHNPQRDLSFIRPTVAEPKFCEGAANLAPLIFY